jgi:hypothetical protein
MFGITAVITTSLTIMAMLWITTLPQSAAQSTSGIEPDEAIEWKNYNSTASGLSIDYPSTWNIQDKQNRFEETCSNCTEGIDLTIDSFVNVSGIIHLLDPDFMSFAVITHPEVPDRNITTLTTTIMDGLLESDKTQIDSQDFENRLIEGVNTSRYKIGGENAGSFITVFEEKNNDYKDAYEYVVTIHNNRVYQFSFMSSPAGVFDTPRVTEIRKHMLDSIKWLDDS